MRKQVEAAIQRALVAWIKKTYSDVRVIATLNENSRHQIDMGCDVGITDLILMRPKNGIKFIFFLELKKKKGKLSTSEIKWAENYRPQTNTHYAVAYGFEDAKEKVIQWIKQV